ncbi:MAG: hypothetical protein V1870_00940 [Candidatus Aenigmatarchaeota archaeon]
MNMLIKDFRADLMNKEVSLEGIVISCDTGIKLYEIIYSCPECANKIPVSQDDSTFIQKPSVCACSFRGDFEVVERKMYDVGIVELIQNGHEKILRVFFKKPQTDPTIWNKIEYGSKITVTGIVDSEKINKEHSFMINAVNFEISGKLTMEERRDILREYLKSNYVSLDKEFYVEMKRKGLDVSDVGVILEEMQRDKEIFLHINRKKEISIFSDSLSPYKIID